jgi:DNA-directed RNA polymerase subunit F
MGILEKLFEERDDEFAYTTLNKSGKPTEDPDKITKVVAVLKQSTSKRATDLGKKYEDILRRQKQIDKDLEEIKDKAVDLVEGLHDARDAIYTRAVETAKVILTLSKESVRKNIKFDQEKFLTKILDIVPDLEKEIKIFEKECTSISETLVKPSFKAELKQEGVSDVIKRVKNYIGTIVDNVKKWATGYDKKLNSIKNEIDSLNTGNVEESYKAYMNRIL